MAILFYIGVMLVAFGAIERFLRLTEIDPLRPYRSRNKWLRRLKAAVLAFLSVGSRDMAAGRNMGYVFAWACTVLVVWTAPNALLLYRWRWKFLNAGKKNRAMTRLRVCGRRPRLGIKRLGLS